MSGIIRLLFGVAAVLAATPAAAAQPRPELVLAKSGFGIGSDLVPTFVLFTDGNLFYRQDDARTSPWMAVQLDDGERRKLVAEVYDSLAARTRCVMPLYIVDAVVPTFYVERDGAAILRRIRGAKAGEKPDLADCDAIFDTMRRLGSFTHEGARPVGDVGDRLPDKSFWERKMREVGE
jgi:hypothetical protein